MNPLAERIQALLDAKGMKRTDLARAAAVPYHQITPWFSRPNAKPNAAALDAVAKVLGVSSTYLLHGNDPEDLRARVMVMFDQLSDTAQVDLQQYAEFLLSKGQRRDPQ